MNTFISVYVDNLTFFIIIIISRQLYHPAILHHSKMNEK